MRRRLFVIGAVCVIFGGAPVARWGLRESGAAVFAGEMRIAGARAQRIVVWPWASGARRPAAGRGSFQEGMSGAALARHDSVFSRNWIRPEASYSVVELPFAVALDGMEVVSVSEPASRLEVSTPEGVAAIDLVPGGSVEIGGEVYRVDAIRPWNGLLRHSSGTPAVDISVRQAGGAWSEHHVVESGAFRLAEAGLGLYHLRAASRGEVEEAASRVFPPALAARWGVVEEAATNWVGSVVPGAGVVLSDGRVVELVEARRSSAGEPAIRVAIPDGTETATHWIEANARPAHGVPVYYEDPASLGWVFAVYAWCDDGATAVVYRFGSRAGQAELAPGESWVPENCGFEVRLDAVVGTAVFVAPGEALLEEAVLEGAARRLRLRQDERVRAGDVSVVFRHESAPPVLRHTLTFCGLDGTELARAVLGAGGRARFGGWTFSQGVPDRRTPEVAVLIVRPARSRVPAVAGAGLVLAGVCVLWFGRRLRVVPGGPGEVAGGECS